MADAFPNSGSAPASATKPLDPRQLLVPGWYWAFLDPSEAGAQWTAFAKGNPSVRATKTVATGGDVAASQKGSWVLFQVGGTSPVVWNLPGFPSKALKGADTDYSDIVATTETPDASQDFLEFWPKLMAQLGTAGQVLLWGGVAVLLFQLYQGTSAPSAGRGRRDEGDYEEREEHHVVTRSPRSGARRRA